MENLKYKHIHFLGIGGISQSALAIILKEKGCFISGSDRVESRTTKKLIEKGIPITINGVSKAIRYADCIVTLRGVGYRFETKNKV